MIYLELNNKTHQCQTLNRDGSTRNISYAATIEQLQKIQPGGLFFMDGQGYRTMELPCTDQITFLALEPLDSTEDVNFDINAVNLASRVFDNCKEESDICFHAVRLSTELLGVDRASILLLSEDHTEIIGIWAVDSEGKVTEEIQTHLPLSGHHWMEEALTYKGQLLVKDYVEIENRVENIGKGWHAIQSIYCDDEPLGLYCCGNIISGTKITPELKAAINYFGTMIGQWLIRKRHEADLLKLNINLEQEVQRKTEDLHATIQQLKNTQRELVETERTKALSTFTAGVAHEINNPIGFIRSNLSYISKVSSRILEKIIALNNVDFQKSVEFLRDIDQVVDESVEGLDRVTNIISMLQPLNKLADEEKQAFQLTQAIEFAIMGLSAPQTEIVIQDQLNNPMVNLQLQIFTLAIENILQNALDAVSNRDNPLIIVKIFCKNHQLYVSCIDNGEGISAPNLSQIFLPFFTTKAPGEGLGLGLSLSQNLIQLAGGNIEAKSDFQLGTTLTISFSEEVIVNG